MLFIWPDFSQLSCTKKNGFEVNKPTTRSLMSKRSAATTETSELADGQSFSKARPSAKDGLASSKRPSLPLDTKEEMGEFEDEWDDEIESDNEVINRAAEGMEGPSDPILLCEILCICLSFRDHLLSCIHTFHVCRS